MEDRIPGGFQHCHEMCCEKDGHCGRRACMVRKWFHCGDIVSRQVDLHMTVCHLVKLSCKYMLFVASLS